MKWCVIVVCVILAAEQKGDRMSDALNVSVMTLSSCDWFEIVDVDVDLCVVSWQCPSGASSAAADCLRSRTADQVLTALPLYNASTLSGFNWLPIIG